MRRRPLALLPLALASVLAVAGCTLPPPPPPGPSQAPAPAVVPPESRAVGLPHAGRLIGGVALPAEGEDFRTWDPILREAPNRGWRRYGTRDTVARIVAVARAHRRAHPDAPRMTVGDLSRPRGGDFGAHYGIVGHATHQNGLDVDVYYPRRDRREEPPLSVGQVDLPLSQALLDAFLAAGAERVFVGPSLALHGPPTVVQALAGHDTHLHVSFPPAPA